ncbi:hypothetical protein BD413DRAFT_122004 [Trametes elegans]|nr:hypothetical protein BD413DRAFT_122004 [Trametes elegans]
MGWEEGGQRLETCTPWPPLGQAMSWEEALPPNARMRTSCVGLLTALRTRVAPLEASGPQGLRLRAAGQWLGRAGSAASAVAGASRATHERAARRKLLRAGRPPGKVPRMPRLSRRLLPRSPPPPTAQRSALSALCHPQFPQPSLSLSHSASASAPASARPRRPGLTCTAPGRSCRPTPPF